MTRAGGAVTPTGGGVGEHRRNRRGVNPSGHGYGNGCVARHDLIFLKMPPIREVVLPRVESDYLPAVRAANLEAGKRAMGPVRGV